jgi:hypothetical protein
MSEMTWTLETPRPEKASLVRVVVEVEGWTEESNRQVSLFVKEILSQGAVMSGRDV